MKFALIIAALFALAGTAMADTTTTRANLIKPDVGGTGWGPKLNSNWDVVDSSVAFLSTTQTFTGQNSFSNSVIMRSGNALSFNATGNGAAAQLTNPSAASGWLKLDGQLGINITPSASYDLSALTMSVSTITVSSATFITLISSTVSVGDGTAGIKGLFYGGGDGSVSTVVDIRNSGTSGGVGTGTRLDFGQGTTSLNEQGSLEFWDEGSLGETFNLYLTNDGTRAARHRVLRINQRGQTNRGVEYWFGPDNGGGANFDFRGSGTSSVSTATVMRVSASNGNATGDIFQLYAHNDTSQRLRVGDAGYTVFSGSVSVAGIIVSSGTQFGSQTLAQLKLLTPGGIGETFYCSDCATDNICTSTSTGRGSYARTSARSTTCQ